MIPSDKCKELIKQFEGCRLVAYPDPATGAAPWTIGYGHTRGVVQGMTCTQEQAENWLVEDLDKVGAMVSDLLKVRVTQREFDALCCFAYNVGIGNLAKSTMLKLINHGDYTQAALEFPKWDRGGGKEIAGLLRRRKSEQAMFEAGENDSA